MDPLSITTGSLTIAKLCAQCIISLAVWVGEVRSVDERVELFCAEIKNLSSNLDAVNNTLLMPEFVQATNEASKMAIVDLWKQLKVSLGDCEKTMEQLRDILDSLKAGFGKGAGLFRRPIKQFRESLESGEISTLRERILFFTSSLGLTIQMLNLAVQISGNATDIQNRNALNTKLDDLVERIQLLSRALLGGKPNDQQRDVFCDTSTGSTLVYNHMEDTLKTADRFIARSRTMTSSKLLPTLQHPHSKPKIGSSGTMLVASSSSSILISQPQESTKIPDREPATRVPSVRQAFNVAASSLVPRSISMQDPEQDFDLDLELTARYLQNGQQKYNDADWENAEFCFRRAWIKFSACSFKGKTTLEKDDVQLMIAATCVEQRKMEDAKSFLRPLAVWKESSNRTRAFVASHVLADLYLYENDFRRAESFALVAVNGRKRHLGSESDLYLASEPGEQRELTKHINQVSKVEGLMHNQAVTIHDEERNYFPNKQLPVKPVDRLVTKSNVEENATEETSQSSADKMTEAVSDTQRWQESILSIPIHLSHRRRQQIDSLNRNLSWHEPPLVNAADTNMKTTRSPSSPDEAFLKVLDSPVAKQHTEQRTNSLTHFQQVVGAILVLFEPLALDDLSQLISLPIKKTKEVLDSPGHYIRHRAVSRSRDRRLSLGLRADIDPSFKKFILDPQRCPNRDFCINRTAMHHHLLDVCLQLMSSLLHQNLLKLPYDSLAIGNSVQLAEEVMPIHLRYACEHWIDHLHEIVQDSSAAAAAHQFLQTHFLHWIEALSHLKIISKAPAIISTLRNIPLLRSRDLREADSREALRKLQDFALDAERFIIRQREILLYAPLQVYSAGLVFSPTLSTIRTTFTKQVPTSFKTLPPVDEYWGACIFAKAIERSHGLFPKTALSSDGQVLAVADGKTIQICSLSTGDVQHTLRNQSGVTIALAFSPTMPPELLASTLWDFTNMTIQVWDVAKGTLKGSLVGHTNHDLLAFKCTGTFVGHTEDVSQVFFSSDGNLVISGSRDHTIRIWNAGNGESHAVLTRHATCIHSIALSQSGNPMASSSKDKSIRLWDNMNDQSCALLNEDCNVWSQLVFSQDGRMLASGLEDGTLSIWDTLTKKKLRSVRVSHRGCGVGAVAFSHDGRFLAAGSWDRTIRVWETERDKTVATLRGHSHGIMSLTFSPANSQILVSGAADKTIRAWDLGKSVASRAPEGHQGEINAALLSPNSQLLATAGTDWNVRLWSTESGSTRMIYKGHTAEPFTLAFSPDGSFLASGGRDQTIHIWDLRTGRTHAVLEGHAGYISGISFSQNSLILASYTSQGPITLWDIRKSKSRGILSQKGLHGLLFVSNHQLVTYHFGNKNIHVWHAEKCKLMRTVAHTDIFSTLQVSMDGGLIVSSTFGSKIQLWDAVSWQLQGTIEGKPFCPRSSPHDADQPLALSPDKKYIAFQTRERTVRLHETSTQQQLGEYRPMSTFPFRFAADSTYLQMGFQRVSLPRLELSVTPNNSCTVDDTCSWVLAGGVPVLWLPPEQRFQYHISVRDDTIALGHGSGYLTFITSDQKPSLGRNQIIPN
ncbi:hypothetical protein H2200_004718 [Cladophialophora chaetospira]|uniref:Mitochondrial division protein 1 n=1 Tax=Cladophialophora chaetospira TaxID=386627 RepID=A0AA38XEA3_9EURO|nr:hypothetical protein H2200_004718 [Cladophialophora chaetospira]